MKKSNLLCLVLMILCLLVFFGYRTMDTLRTDTGAPVISISPDALSVSVLDEKSALLAGITASDAVDGDVTDSLIVESFRLSGDDGSASVGYAAFDAAGNVAKAERSVKLTDYQAPRFELSEPLVFVFNSNFEVLDRITATDTLDGNISHRIRATSLDPASITAIGIHDVEFRVTNSLGDTVETVLPVEVYAAGLYDGTLTLTDYLVYIQAGTAFDAEHYLDTFKYGGESYVLSHAIPSNLTLHTSGTVDTATPGVYSVSYTVSYANSTASSAAGYSKLIVIVEG